jgi:hypothetical protein
MDDASDVFSGKTIRDSLTEWKFLVSKSQKVLNAAMRSTQMIGHAD